MFQCPCSLREHKLINPFLRTGEIELLRSLGLVTDEEIETNNVEVDEDLRIKALIKIRQRKDEYQTKLQRKI